MPSTAIVVLIFLIMIQDAKPSLHKRTVQYTQDMPTEEATTRVVNRGHGHKGDYVGEEEHTLEKL
jgi:hypothetical protein